MSNLNIELDEINSDGIIGEAVGLLDKLNCYLQTFFNDAKPYILEGLLEPEMRDKILACFDEQHRPDIVTWESRVRRRIIACPV